MEDILDEVEPLIAALIGRACYALSDLAIPVVLARVQGLIGALTAFAAALARDAEGRGLPAQMGFRSTRTWLQEALFLSRSSARQITSLAEVCERLPATGSTVGRGQITPDQAVAIGATLAALASGVEASILTKAEESLLDQAATFGPDQLAILGERILHHVAPDIAEEEDRLALERAEQRAHLDRGLAFVHDRQLQRTRITGWLTAEQAAQVTAAIEPLARPVPKLDGITVDERTASQRRADALAEICRTHTGYRAPADPACPHMRDPEARAGADLGQDAEPPCARTAIDPAPACTGIDTVGNRDLDTRFEAVGGGPSPACAQTVAPAGAAGPPTDHQSCPDGGATDDREGGDRADDDLALARLRPASAWQIAMTVDFDVLRRELSHGLLDTGQRLTPTSVRRLACDAHILPAVLGGTGQILDLGRTQRTWTGSARRAILIRDRGCVFPHCDRPATACDIHHIEYWSHGGPTDLTNGALLCAFHHHLIHHSDWELTIGADGVPDVIPPAWLDPLQRPRRNEYHRRR